MIRVFKGKLTRRDFLWMVSAVSAGAVLPGCSTDPVTGKRSLVLMSRAEEIAIDRNQSPHQFSADYGVSQDQGLGQYLTGVGNSLASQSHRPDMPYSFQVVNANYVNAYAFPGGTIACTRGIMLEVESEDQLAALLGHEIGHVNARHAAERQTQSVLANAAVAGAAIYAGTQDASYAGVVAGLGGVASGALLAHYSRDNEREADALGLEYMDRAGNNPKGMLALMDMLNSQSAHKPSTMELMFATHPMSSERVKNTQRALSEKYQANQSKPLKREIYMDNTAKLRAQKKAIVKQQEGEALLGQKKPKQATVSFKSALAISPDDYTGLVLMSKSLLMQDKVKEAQPYLDKATQIYPQEAQGQQLKGIAALQLKQPQQAFDAFAAYDKVLPGNPNTLFFKALSLEGMQQKEQAAQEYYRYLKSVNRGDMAQHAYGRLKSWGYL